MHNYIIKIGYVQKYRHGSRGRRLITVQMLFCSALHTNTHTHTQAATLSGCVLVVLNEPSQAKVSDLAHQIVSDEDVSRPQVTVDVVHPFDVRHSSCDLRQTQSGERSSGRGSMRVFKRVFVGLRLAHLRGHVHQLRQLQVLPLAVFQEVQQTSWKNKNVL